MADEKLGYDALRFYYTGASAHLMPQADPSLSRGRYRSNTEMPMCSWTLSGDLSSILEVKQVSATNMWGGDSGTITATDADKVTWTEPGSSTPGAEVTILNGETKVLIGDDTGCWIRITRVAADSMSGLTGTVAVTPLKNGALGLGQVTSALAATGSNEYRVISLLNESILTMYLVWVGIGALSLDDNIHTSVSYLSSSGAGEIEGDNDDLDADYWPESGFCLILDSAKTTIKEVVYYYRRSNSRLYVAANGRGMLNTTATAGASTDHMRAVPGIRVGKVAHIMGYNQFPWPIESNLGTVTDWTLPTETGFSILCDDSNGIVIHRQIPPGVSPGYGDFATNQFINHIIVGFTLQE